LEREKENSFISPDETVSSFFVRCDKSDDEIESVFGNVKFIEDGAFITENIREDEFAVKTERLGGVLAKIRVYN
jgi:hypothetical protein